MTLDPSLELDFVREFSGRDDLLRDLNPEQRRERIRVAIYTAKVADKMFRDGPMTYRDAFQKCYGRPLEMRKHLRLVSQPDKSDEI